MTNREDFIIKYKISDSLPTDPSAKIILALYFVEAIDEFLSENFKGCIKVSRDNLAADSVLVSGDYAAYLFKLLLTEIYGRVFLKMNIGSNDSELVMTIEADEPLPLCDSELRRIIKAARNAGMEIMPTDMSLTLTLKYNNAKSHKIYAIPPADGRLYIRSKLIEIFYE